MEMASLPIRSFRASRSELQSVPVDVTRSIEQADQTIIAQAPNLGQAFQDLSVDGSIAIYNKNNDRFYEHNRDRNTTAFFPASTFKILNALISLETGVIRDNVSVLTWDGVQREIPAWNRDTNLRQAFKDSTVWFARLAGIPLDRVNGYRGSLENGADLLGPIVGAGLISWIRTVKNSVHLLYRERMRSNYNSRFTRLKRS